MSDVEQQEKFAAAMVKASIDSLPDSDKDKLSKVLFPETHTVDANFCGAKRTLHPVPLKVAKKIFSVMQPFAEAATKAGNDETKAIAGDPMLADALLNVGICLCEFYNWGDDVKQKLVNEEVMVSELQELAAVQTQVQGANDFMLAALRLALQIMRVRSLMDIHVSSLKDESVIENIQSTLTTQP